jgi:hypothetical protein
LVLIGDIKAEDLAKYVNAAYVNAASTFPYKEGLVIADGMCMDQYQALAKINGEEECAGIFSLNFEIVYVCIDSKITSVECFKGQLIFIFKSISDISNITMPNLVHKLIMFHVSDPQWKQNQWTTFINNSKTQYLGISCQTYKKDLHNSLPKDLQIYNTNIWVKNSMFYKLLNSNNLFKKKPGKKTAIIILEFFLRLATKNNSLHILGLPLLHETLHEMGLELSGQWICGLKCLLNESELIKTISVYYQSNR